MMRLAMEQGILEVFQQHYYSWDEKVGVGDIIEKIIDCRYIGIFSSYRQIIDIEKKRFWNYQKIINTRSYAALRAADLDWIVGPGYSPGG